MSRESQSRVEPTVLQVFIFREGRFFGTECFAQQRIVMGRNPDVDLELDDDQISRTHASVQLTPEGLLLEDLNSSNGTYVNGVAIQRCLVKSADEVSIGSFVLKFKVLSRNKREAPSRTDDRRAGHDPSDLALEEETEQLMESPLRIDTTPRMAAKSSTAGPPRIQPPSQEAQPPSDELPTKRSMAPVLGVGDRSSRADDDWSDLGSSRLEVTPDLSLAEEDFTVRVAPERASPAQHVKSEDFSDLANELELERKRGAYGNLKAVPPPDRKPAAIPSVPEAAPLRPKKIDLELPLLENEPTLAVQTPPQSMATKTAEEDDDEAEDAAFIEPFSLLNNLVKETFEKPAMSTEPTLVLEVIGYDRDKRVEQYDQVLPRKKYRISPKRFVLVTHESQGSGRLRFTNGFTGGLIIDGRTVPLNDIKTQTYQIDTRDGEPVFACKLGKGDYANINTPEGGFFLRFVYPPKLPPVKSFKPDPVFMRSLGSSAILHLMVALILGIIAGVGGEAVSSDNRERFAKIDLKDIEIPKKEEPEIPLDQLKPAEPKPEEKKPTKEIPKPVKTNKPERTAGAPQVKQETSAGAGMLAALGNLQQKKTATNIVAAVSNLDAVRVPGGEARFKVSGVVTKLPTSSVLLSRGQGLGVKTDIDLLRGGKDSIGPGALTGGMTGKRGVGAVVFKAPSHLMKVQGFLNREEIAKVVNQHLREIQYCYEKNLLLNPSLAGKVIMEWTITTAGSVSVVKTAFNSLQSADVAMCVSAKIKEWRFPLPKGGIVVVSYPFIFNSVGF